MSSTLEMTCQVLLVDDDPHLRQALSQTLDLAGFKVSTRADAQGLAAQLPTDWPGVVGQSEAMRLVCERLKRIAPTPSTVLLLGESGTGKEVAARALPWAHRSEKRRMFIAEV